LPSVYPIRNGFRSYMLLSPAEPQLSLQLNGRTVTGLLDSGAHVSVVPYAFIAGLNLVQTDQLPTRSIRVFGGTPLTLQGPLNLTVTIAGVQQLHPFYFINAEVPYIFGYDFMKAFGIVLDGAGHRYWLRGVMNSTPYSSFLSGRLHKPSTTPYHSTPVVRHIANVCSSSNISVVSADSSLCRSSQMSGCFTSPQVSTVVPLVVSQQQSLQSTSVNHSSDVVPVVHTLVDPLVTSHSSETFCVDRQQLYSSHQSGLFDSHHPSNAVSSMATMIPLSNNADEPCTYPQFDIPHWYDFEQTFCKTSLAHSLDPEAPSFTPQNPAPHGTPFVYSAQAQPDIIIIPPHLVDLYETTTDAADLTDEVDCAFQQLLARHASTFANSKMDFGYCPLITHDIDTGDSPPIRQSPRRPPLSSGTAEDDILDEMLEAGIIEPSISPWASPVCLVKKPDNTYRFCIDYRKVNAVSVKDAYPVPDIRDALDNLRGAKCFATIDLLSGYWQIGMTERAKERSAFCTRRGLFQFLRMPFGLTGAPATFCRLMHKILNEILYKICICYIDDVIVYAADNLQLLQRIDCVLTKFQRNGLKVKPSKCVLFRTEIDFLGHLVNQHGILPQPEKLKAIKEWPVPRCLREVRAFVGLASYYRRFVNDFASKAEPLTALTRAGLRFNWTDRAQTAFEKLKDALLETPVLAFPYPNKPCILDTDASDVAIGAVLSQVVDGLERPIAFFSKVMSPAQRNYCATRRELLAVIAAMQHFRHYLLNNEIILRTDHHSLKWLRTFKHPEGILARWIETLAEFSYTVEHRPGRVHCNADGLSRQQCKQCWGKVIKTPWVDELQRADDIVLHAIQLLPELTSEEVADMQTADTALGPLMDMLDSNTQPTTDQLRELHPEARRLWSQRHLLTIRDGVLVRVTDTMTQLVVPHPLRQRLFQHVHAGPMAAHLAAERTLIQIKQHYYWPSMAHDINTMCRACDTCALGRGPPTRAHGKLQKVFASAPMDLVAIDILSGLPTADDGSTCILVAVDYFTKWVEAYALPNEEAATCMQVLFDNFFARFGLPAQLHSDQGRNFESKLVAELTKLTGIRRTRTTSFHPQCDGQTERMIKTILQMLRATAHDHPSQWPSKLPTILAAYRMSRHKVTGTTPNFSMLGREVRCPATLIAAPPDDNKLPDSPFNQTFQQNMRQAHEKIRSATRQVAKTQKNYFDAHVRSCTFTAGQLVWLFRPRPLLRQRYRKLTYNWEGPYRIINFRTDVIVDIQHVTNRKKLTVHINRLTPCNSNLPTAAPAATQDSTRPQTDTPNQDNTNPATSFNQPLQREPTDRPARRRKPPVKLADYVTA